MIFHTMVGSNNIERSRRFYDALTAVVCGGPALTNVLPSGHTRLFYRTKDGTTFAVTEPINDEPATVGNGSTVAFACSSPEQVRVFHDVAVAHGGTSIENPPGLRDTSFRPLHLAYVRDPDGNKLCGIHMGG